VTADAPITKRCDGKVISKYNHIAPIKFTTSFSFLQHSYPRVFKKHISSSIPKTQNITTASSSRDSRYEASLGMRSNQTDGFSAFSISLLCRDRIINAIGRDSLLMSVS
jgi:hypothetical protein